MNTQGMKNLMTHIITQAYQDLYRLQTRQEALRFFLSADCKSYCAALGYSPEKSGALLAGEYRQGYRITHQPGPYGSGY